MLTPLGRFLRKIRIDNSEILAHMAAKLGVTASYVSAVENGRRAMPSEWREKIIEMYALDEQQQAEFTGLAIDLVTQVTVNTKNSTRSQKEVVFAFARKVSELPEDKLFEIRRILGGEKD
ncbi:MAG: helix-turn-helix domain-containing protein [Coriobacteriales bacterium]|jgi:transcriptional regulator with XRE-family HTH domain|nr:helix-turn-helix domain-containing protein [Coriobacteriales bacterium]